MTDHAPTELIQAAPAGQKALFVPTKDQCAVVRRLVALGMPLDRVCLAVTNHNTGNPVNRTTLSRAFEVEIRESRVTVDEKIAGYLLEHCRTNFNACKFYVESNWGVGSLDDPASTPFLASTSETTAPAATDLAFARKIAFLLEKAVRSGSAASS